MFELRPSRLPYYTYLCMPVRSNGSVPVAVSKWCHETFGEMGTNTRGRWYLGLMGFYFVDQTDAVQFILSWG